MEGCCIYSGMIQPVCKFLCLALVRSLWTSGFICYFSGHIDLQSEIPRLVHVHPGEPHKSTMVSSPLDDLDCDTFARVGRPTWLSDWCNISCVLVVERSWRDL